MKTPSFESYHTQLARALFVLWFALVHIHISVPVWAQNVAERLQQGVDDPEGSQNEFRGGSDQRDDNMKQLFAPLMSDAGGEIDKWYNPHLRDTRISNSNRDKQAKLRAEAGVAITWYNDAEQCLECRNGLNTKKTACPICQPDNSGCNGQDWYDDHLHDECCLPSGQGTKVYKEFTKDTNFKTCCVKIEEESYTEERIACLHPKGDGWAGLFEYYYPTTALGWENERTSTMIAKKDEVTDCVEEVDSMMEDDKAVDWVSKAIERNQKMAAGESPSDVSGSAAKSNVQNVIKEVRPQDKKLRFSDSLQGEGLTVRVNFPLMDPAERKKIAKHFCMRPEQFDKLMDPAYDDVQLEGGPTVGALEEIEIWSNYCPKGVELMTNTEFSKGLKNIDGTKTDLVKGYDAWSEDPLYCQRINASANQNMEITKIKEVIEKSQGAGRTASEVGYTCSANGKLNGGMVPLSLYRHAAVERRAAISDHALGFLIAAGLFKDGGMVSGQKSKYKRFEPLPYSWIAQDRIFKGKQHSQGGTNELQYADPGNSSCKGYSGENYQGKDTSDQLYISDFTHKVFTQEPIINVGSTDAFDKYRQEWATDESRKEIAKRGLDKEVHNYAAAFRKFATCPKGFVRWRPPSDEHNMNLVSNLNLFCNEENFGGNPS